MSEFLESVYALDAAGEIDGAIDLIYAHIDEALMSGQELSVSETCAAVFWESMRKAAEPVRDAPDWMKAGINLSSNFETFLGPEGDYRTAPSERPWGPTIQPEESFMRMRFRLTE